MSKSQMKAVKEKTSQKVFNFCVGRPWDENRTVEHSSNRLSIYAYGSQVQYGSIKEAEEFRQYVNKQTGKENFIYKIIQVPH